MFEEDDYPDYFLGDDDDDGRQESPSVTRRQEYETTPRPGQTISFGGGDTDDDRSRDGGSRQRGHAESAGCLGLGGTLGKLGCAVSAVFLIIVAVIVYVRYLTPVVSDAVMDVYVTSVQQRGVFFKTYEAEVVDPGRVGDTTQAYTHSVAVTIEDEALARRLQQIQSTGRIVRLHYKQYSATLPWRGESKTVITSAD